MVGHDFKIIGKGYSKWNGKESPKSKSDYSKHVCIFKCDSLARTFFYCDFNLIICQQCYGEHIYIVQSERRLFKCL